MPKVKYDVRDVDASGGFETPPPGLYRATIVEVNAKTSSKDNPMLEIVYELKKGDFKGSRVWDYITLTDAQRFKLRQFLEAVGKVTEGSQKGAKGSLDTDEFEGEEVQLKLKNETYEEEQRARVANVLPLPDEEEELDEDEDEDEDEGADEEYTYEDIEEMDLADLKGVIEEEDLDIRVTKKSKVETVLAKVAEALELEPDEDEDEEDGDGYDEMSVEELRDECKERGLRSGGAKKVLIARLEKDDEDDDNPFDD